MEYLVTKLNAPIALDAPFDSGAWGSLPFLRLENFRTEGSGHRPEVRFKLGWSDDGLYGLFDVNDRYVRAVAEKFQDPVCRDSCVELFVEPAGNNGYINFEINCSGILLVSHVRDHRREPGKPLKDARPLSPREAAGIRIFHSMPDRVEPEITEPVHYNVGFFIPFSLFAEVMNAPVPCSGTVWRANVYKCADKTSHPHWASWQPVPELNFHLPASFGGLRFG